MPTPEDMNQGYFLVAQAEAAEGKAGRSQRFAGANLAIRKACRQSVRRSAAARGMVSFGTRHQRRPEYVPSQRRVRAAGSHRVLHTARWLASPIQAPVRNGRGDA